MVEHMVMDRKGMVGRLVSVWLALSLGMAMAADSDGDSRASRLDEVTVIGESVDRNVLLELGQPSAALDIATSRIDGVTLRLQGAGDLAEALEYMPGAHTESRGRKLRQFTSFRGQIYPYPDYAINGMWMGKFDEAPKWFPVSQVQALEVVRSSAALTLGLSDLVGVIKVEPARFEDRTTLFETEAGSYGALRGSITHGDTTERGWYTVGLNHTQQQGPEDENAGEDVQSVMANVGLMATDRLTLEATMFYISGYREWPVPNDPDPAYNTLRSRPETYDPFEQYFVGVRARYRQNESSTTEITASLSERNGDYFKPNGPANEREGSDVDREYTLTATQALALSDANTLRIGAVFNRWWTKYGSHFWHNAPSDLDTYGVFVVDEHQFDRLLLDGGIRYTRTYNEKRSARGFTISSGYSGGNTVEDEWSDPLLTCTLGAKYRLTEMVNLYAHVALGQSQPAAGYQDVDGNSLNDELRLMGDSGFELRDPTFGTVKIGGFYVYRDDAAVYHTLDVNNDALFQNSDIEQYGLELEYRSPTIRDAATVYLNVTAMNSTKEPEKEPEKSGDYVEVPNYIVNGGVYSRWGGIDVNVFAKYVSGYENRRFDKSKYHDLGDYVDLNLTAGYTFGKDKSTRIYGSIKNMLNDDYSTVDGWEDYGAEFAVGLQHKF